jgi:plasmid stabilization system protein ParE
MAVHLIWSFLAQGDLAEIVAYIRKDNPAAAKTLAESLVKQVDLLADFPQMGRIVPEREDPLVREIIHRNYRIIYRYIPSSNRLEIARVWHAARGEPEL